MPLIGGGSLGTPGSGGGVQTQIDTITANGSWTRPSWARTGTFILVSGQGGGGSGRRGAAASARFGGGGAGGAAYVIQQFPVSVIDATGSVTIGAGGTGGAAVTTDNTDGNPGTLGGNTTVVVSVSNNITLQARLSTNGLGGTAAAGTNGGGNPGMFPAVNGGASSITAKPTAPSGSTFSSGGGAGGGISAADVAFDGGNAGGLWAYSSFGSSAGGVVGGASPVAGSITSWGSVFASIGGGGGAASTVAAAQNGALGGGGGGASVNGFNSGAGGNGHNGLVLILWEG